MDVTIPSSSPSGPTDTGLVTSAANLPPPAQRPAEPPTSNLLSVGYLPLSESGQVALVKGSISRYEPPTSAMTSGRVTLGIALISSVKR